MSLFKPNYKISPVVAQALIRIERAKQSILDSPLTSKVESELRESAKLVSTHYSTKIEGNRLTLEEAREVINEKQHFPGRERDEKEILGYYKSLDEIHAIVQRAKGISEMDIQRLHAFVMGGGKSKVKPSPYRDGQNVIRNSRSNEIVYLPPEAKDVSTLMSDFVDWITKTGDELPSPIRAGIAHYQFATIHPYYDGNGRTARLLTTLILHLDGYDLNGFYSLEEYYGENLSAYYKAIAVGQSHNYYEGREEAEITNWLEYFCFGMAEAFEKVQRAIKTTSNSSNDIANELKSLDSRQRRALSLFQKGDVITAQDVATLFKIKARTARVICQKWVENEFIITDNPSKKGRRYKLHPHKKKLVL